MTEGRQPGMGTSNSQMAWTDTRGLFAVRPQVSCAIMADKLAGFPFCSPDL